ncbi:transcriptional regulator [Acinetobacter baumannii]|uniref:transcriptional regulator n=1 Tax=Acinetobacter baumannii TaxID=470 RepID=UPI001CDBAF16|nr:transcriptional regulator [Acinetobacter baumannii]MCA4383404.1 transcriptional regulator [Acinetobacter baumannii]
MSGFNRIDPIRVSLPRACELLDISRESLRHIVRTDASFPRPIKTGESKQSPVYFDYAELVEWHNSKKVDQNKEPSHG